MSGSTKGARCWVWHSVTMRRSPKVCYYPRVTCHCRRNDSGGEFAKCHMRGSRQTYRNKCLPSAPPLHLANTFLFFLFIYFFILIFLFHFLFFYSPFRSHARSILLCLYLDHFLCRHSFPYPLLPLFHLCTFEEEKVTWATHFRRRARGKPNWACRIVFCSKPREDGSGTLLHLHNVIIYTGGVNSKNWIHNYKVSLSS